MCLPACLPGKELVVYSSGETRREGVDWRGSILLGRSGVECRRGGEG